MAMRNPEGPHNRVATHEGGEGGGYARVLTFRRPFPCVLEAVTDGLFVTY